MSRSVVEPWVWEECGLGMRVGEGGDAGCRFVGWGGTEVRGYVEGLGW